MVVDGVSLKRYVSQIKNSSSRTWMATSIAFRVSQVHEAGDVRVELHRGGLFVRVGIAAFLPAERVGIHRACVGGHQFLPRAR